jgi:hypothetical protein
MKGEVSETFPLFVTTTEPVPLPVVGTFPIANEVTLKAIEGLAVPVPVNAKAVEVPTAEIVIEPESGTVSVGANTKISEQVAPAPREEPQVLEPDFVTVVGNAVYANEAEVLPVLWTLYVSVPVDRMATLPYA